jgi:hypothetical protein
MQVNYKKYLKYKNKYLNIKSQIGGECNPEPNPDDEAPIDLVKYKDINPTDLITIGNQCYTIDSIYEWVIGKGKSSNPMTNQTISEDDKKKIMIAYKKKHGLPDAEIVDGKLIIPDYYTFIPTNLYHHQNIRKLSLPPTIRTIGESAFYTNKITELIIPDSVTFIGKDAFMSNEIQSLILGNSLFTIGINAFRKNKIPSLIIPNSVQTIDKYAFYDNEISELVIGNSVNYIAEGAFRNNKIKTLNIPGSVRHIEKLAFQYNPLVNVTINEGVLSIGYNAMYIDSTVIIPNSIQFIDEFAFGNAFGGTVYPRNVTMPLRFNNPAEKKRIFGPAHDEIIFTFF